MHRPAVLWTLAIVLTLALSVWQRLSGPTRPVRGRVTLGGQEIRFRLTRTHAGPGDQIIRVIAPDTAVTGQVLYRRYPTGDPWVLLPMFRYGDTLVAGLPHQPPAGKLAYEVRLRRGAEWTRLTRIAVVTRFKGDVPPWVLAPHILAMLLALLFSARAGVGALVGEPELRRWAWSAATALLVGGFILGPIALWYAFGMWWEGAPLGWDITDNKTLIAGLVWLRAALRMRNGGEARGPIATAALVTLGVFAIPHSLWGTEMDWTGRE
jgi:hypothetical protein